MTTTGNRFDPSREISSAFIARVCEWISISGEVLAPVKSMIEEQNGTTKKRGESQRLNSNAGRLSPTSAIGLDYVERSPD